MQNDKKNKEDAQLKKRKKMALGRGLGALIPDTEQAETQLSPVQYSKEYLQCDIDQIHPKTLLFALSKESIGLKKAKKKIMLTYSIV